MIDRINEYLEDVIGMSHAARIAKENNDTIRLQQLVAHLTIAANQLYELVSKLPHNHNPITLVDIPYCAIWGIQIYSFM